MAESQNKLMNLGELEVGDRPAVSTLEPGLERIEDFMVEDRLVTDVGGVKQG